MGELSIQQVTLCQWEGPRATPVGWAQAHTWCLWVGWEQCSHALPSCFMGLGSRLGFASRAVPALHSDGGGGLSGPGGQPVPPRCTLCSLC